MKFEVIGSISATQIIATGQGVRMRRVLREVYGAGQWRKLKGVATVRLANGSVRRVELHWFEAHGIGKRDVKIKRYFDEP